MERVVSFYEKLPRGPAPAPKPSGLLERYQARYFGKNPSGARLSLLNFLALNDALLILILLAIVHVIASMLLLGYGMDYYYHLRTHPALPNQYCCTDINQGHHKHNAH